MSGSHPVWFLASSKSSFKVRSSCLCIMMLCVLPQRTTEKSLIQPSSWSFIRYLKTANTNLLSVLLSRLSKSSSLSPYNQETGRNPYFLWALNLIVGRKPCLWSVIVSNTWPCAKPVECHLRFVHRSSLSSVYSLVIQGDWVFLQLPTKVSSWSSQAFLSKLPCWH